MSDRQVSSVDGQTYQLPRPFMVIATQNPFEFEGTYPLPESQLDRFLMRISLGYPDRDDELQVLTSHRAGEPVETLTPVLDGAQIRGLQESVRQVAVDEAIQEYCSTLCAPPRAAATSCRQSKHASDLESVSLRLSRWPSSKSAQDTTTRARSS